MILTSSFLGKFWSSHLRSTGTDLVSQDLTQGYAGENSSWCNYQSWTRIPDSKRAGLHNPRMQHWACYVKDNGYRGRRVVMQNHGCSSEGKCLLNTALHTRNLLSGLVFDVCFMSRYVGPNIWTANKRQVMIRSMEIHALRTAQCSPSPRASMKVRQGLLIISNWRNTGASRWDLASRR